VLNCEDDDFVCCFIDELDVHKIGSLRVTSLANALEPLRAADLGNSARFCNASRIADRTRDVRVMSTDIVGNARGPNAATDRQRGLGSLAERIEASSVKSTDGGLDVVIGCKLAALGLREPREDRRKMRGIQSLPGRPRPPRDEDGACNFMPAVRCQMADPLKGWF
jgi:hypothetical protein